MAKIRNKITGEIKEVLDTELSSYGLSSSSVNLKSNTPPISTIPGNTGMPVEDAIEEESTQPKSITGHTIEEHAQALSKAKAAGDTTAIKQITDDYNREYAYQKDTGSIEKKAKETAKEQDAKKAKELISSNAQAVLDVLNNKDKYASEKEYKDALQYVASRMSSAVGFGEGGKVLSPAELGILSGSLVNIKPQRQQNVIERLTGEVPAATGEITDPEETIRNKMNNAISYISTGKVNEPTAQKTETESKDEKLNLNLYGNAVNDIKDMVQGLISLPEIAVRVAQSPEETLPEIGMSLLKEIEATIGYKNGSANILDALKHAYNNPVDTAVWLVPLLKLGKVGAIGKVTKTADVAEDVGKTGALLADGSSAIKTAEGIGLKGELAGRSATSLGVTDLGSVVKSEEAMKTALQKTTSNTIRGMARERELSIPKNGKLIDDQVLAMDKVVGQQPMDEIVNQILTKIKNTTAAQANPELIKQVDLILRKQLATDSKIGIVGQTPIDATDFSKMNDARKYLTSNLGKWFENGQPVGNPTDDLNSIKWSAANGIKDIIAEADKQGVIKELLSDQHNAFETFPVLSREALKSKYSGNLISILRNAYNTVTTPARVSSARALQGKMESPATPELTLASGESAVGSSATMIPKTTQKPLVANEPDMTSATSIGTENKNRIILENKEPLTPIIKLTPSEKVAGFSDTNAAKYWSTLDPEFRKKWTQNVVASDIPPQGYTIEQVKANYDSWKTTKDLPLFKKSDIIKNK